MWRDKGTIQRTDHRQNDRLSRCHHVQRRHDRDRLASLDDATTSGCNEFATGQHGRFGMVDQSLLCRWIGDEQTENIDIGFQIRCWAISCISMRWQHYLTNAVLTRQMHCILRIRLSMFRDVTWRPQGAGKCVAHDRCRGKVEYTQMIRLIDRTVVRAPPEVVWAWFAALDENYCSWHPEHLVWRTLRGAPLSDGTVAFADEWIGHFRLATRFRIVDAHEPHSFRMELLGWHRLAGGGGSFTFERHREGCEVIAEVRFGYELPVVGGLLDGIAALILPMEEMRRHMAEEGTNLARLIGGSG